MVDWQVIVVVAIIAWIVIKMKPEPSGHHFRVAAHEGPKIFFPRGRVKYKRRIKL